MIIPVILEKNFKDIVKKVKLVDQKAPLIQIDILDGTMTETTTFTNIKKLNRIKTFAKLEIHLMVEDPMEYLDIKLTKGIKICTQIEGMNIKSFLDKAETLGYLTGLSLQTQTPLTELDPYIETLDFVQFMTVKIGRQGQEFDSSVFEKIKTFRQNHPLIPIQVDGGVNEENIMVLKKAGVDNMVVGSAIYMSGNPAEKYIQLETLPWTK